MFDHKNQYPVILVPGVASYGEGASAARVAKSMGLECRLVSFGLVSGIWDRACELYAQIFGGRVDYGEAHSKKYGHSRFGKFYSGMTAKDPEKINIIAYGFGAPATARKRKRAQLLPKSFRVFSRAETRALYIALLQLPA